MGLTQAVQIFMTTLSLLMAASAPAGSPLWTFAPLTSTTVSVPANGGATIQYTVTNQSSKMHTLVMNPIAGISQVTVESGACGNPFVLTKNASCVLTLAVNGSQLTNAINDGPVVCQQGTVSQCYRPSEADILHVSQTTAVPLPSNCVNTENNDIQCQVTLFSQTNYGLTNMTYALCRSAQCPYNGSQTDVTCSCSLISDYQGAYSVSSAPQDYNTSKPVGNQITSTYSRVNSAGETPTDCPSGPFANCYGATCTIGANNSVTCTCPVVTSTYIAPSTSCAAAAGTIWSATSVSSFPSIDGTAVFMYDTFFEGDIPD